MALGGLVRSGQVTSPSEVEDSVSSAATVGATRPLAVKNSASRLGRRRLCHGVLVRKSLSCSLSRGDNFKEAGRLIKQGVRTQNA